MTSPRIGIILVNLNSYTDTSLCLRSLQMMTYPNAEIIVVDAYGIESAVVRGAENVTFPAEYAI